MNTQKQRSISATTANLGIDDVMGAPVNEITHVTWTQEEIDSLYWYFVQFKKSDDVVGKIIEQFSGNGNSPLKSRLGVIQHLLQQVNPHCV